MKNWINTFGELTELQKVHARGQYIWLRSCEEETTEEEYLKEKFNCDVNLMYLQDNKDVLDFLDEMLKSMNIEIDTEDENYIYVNL